MKKKMILLTLIFSCACVNFTACGNSSVSGTGSETVEEQNTTPTECELGSYGSIGLSDEMTAEYDKDTQEAVITYNGKEAVQVNIFLI